MGRIPVRALDPIPGLFTIQDPNDCPAFELGVPSESNGAYVAATVELYVSVNGVEVRPEVGSTGANNNQAAGQLP